MRVVGLITEYNPFHNGHKYHLEKSKEISRSNYSVAVMSGNFLQRGEPAIVDKWTRAKMAIDSGVDLVIELPVVYACQSAEYFSYGSVKLLDSLGVVDSIVFGSESGDVKKINAIADILLKEPNNFKNYLKDYLSKGNTFPKSRTKALIKYARNHLNSKLSTEDIEDIINSPNNILGIEYLKALKKINSKIVPYTIKRIGSDYHQEDITGKFSSATSIRKKIFEDGNLDTIKDIVPYHTYIHLNNFLNKYGSFNKTCNYNDILQYILINTDRKKLKEILDVEEGLENRILKCFNENNTIEGLINCIKTKRYTLTRIQRIIMHLLININEKIFSEFHKTGPLYIRVLGFNSKGIELLREAKKKAKLPIITNFSNYRKLKDHKINRMISFDKRATDIYFLGLKNYNSEKKNLDFYTNPYIKK
ncbi:nucleotidyltransferase [Thermohalobacter berrensis]|uniref:tRNA(Met) cytidine acetate ligase n=1 Tax=Thermohalobacter berrensis TaxID=99594 RepID=A0A419TAA0_9FIRM|nr:nucleotidyltransferase [Thermohalobacter berrensis]RKD34392.1 hypothetical protein BET03_00740 [Thermohalobacter berrensis]